MRMVQCEIRPGVVLKVVDEYGTIKGSCTGMFSIEDDVEMLPPIYPFFKSSPTQFSKPNVGDKIWVWTFYDNPQELFYVFQGDVQNTVGESLKKSTGDLGEYGNSLNVLMKCDSGFEGAELSFSSGDGWNMQNDSGSMKINNEGEINIVNDGGSINMDDGGIHLSGVEHTVARGDVVRDKFTKLESLMEIFAKTLQNNNFTAAAGVELEGLIKTYMKDYDEIESKGVTTK